MLERALYSTAFSERWGRQMRFITGPRQSGKTTLSRMAFGDHEYCSLEEPDIRRQAQNDPKGLLAGFAGGVILDEIQRVPELLSYLQGMIDEDPNPGRFILTGSHQPQVHHAVSQSLAGRTAILELLAGQRLYVRQIQALRQILLWRTGQQINRV